MSNHQIEADATLDERIEDDIVRGYPLDPEDSVTSPYWVKVIAEHNRRKRG